MIWVFGSCPIILFITDPSLDNYIAVGQAPAPSSPSKGPELSTYVGNVTCCKVENAGNLFLFTQEMLRNHCMLSFYRKVEKEKNFAVMGYASACRKERWAHS